MKFKAGDLVVCNNPGLYIYTSMLTICRVDDVLRRGSSIVLTPVQINPDCPESVRARVTINDGMSEHAILGSCGGFEVPAKCFDMYVELKDIEVNENIKDLFD